MLGLLALPVLLGVLLAFDVFGDDDSDEAETPETPEAPQAQVVSDGFIGTDAAELLRLDPQGGFVNGGGGADTISGSDNGDGILGGRGNDQIFARGGDDTVSGDAGDDRIFLGDGNDEYTPDDETAANTAGNDFVNGGRGADFIVDLLGSNNLAGSAGNDVLVAFDGLDQTGNYSTPSELGTTDTLSGGFGNDILAGDDGDMLEGFVGNDMFFVTDDEDTDLAEVRIIDFAPDEDTLMVVQLDGLRSADALSFDAVEEGVRVSYEGRAVALLEGLTAADIPDITVGITNLDGLDDAINGDVPPPPAPPVVFAPPPAASTFDTAPPAPAPQPTSEGVTLETDRDPVRLTGTGGDDTITATGDVLSIRGSSGNDLLFGAGNDENIDGGNGMDTIVAGGGNDTFSGGSGDDLIYLGDGNDVSAGFGGQDPGNDTVYGGAGDDELRDDTGRNLTFGSEGNDQISSVNSLSGAEPDGADTLIGGEGNDTLNGDAGDLIYGGIGADLIRVFDNGPAATIIADFSVGDDALEIVLPTAPSQSIDFAHDPAQNGVSIAVDGEIIAFLHGLTADQADAVRTSTSIVISDRIGDAA